MAIISHSLLSTVLHLTPPFLLTNSLHRLTNDCDSGVAPSADKNDDIVMDLFSRVSPHTLLRYWTEPDTHLMSHGRAGR